MDKMRGSLVFLAPSMFCLLLISLLYTGYFGSYLVPLNLWKEQMMNKGGSCIEDQENLHFLLKKLVKGMHTVENKTQLQMTGFACHSDHHTDVCVSNGPVMIDTLTMKVYTPFYQGMPQANHTILPFPKKEDSRLLRKVSSVQILQGNPPPPCRYTHDVPAVVFSSGGFSGNIYHDFSEIIIPLFLTSRLFQSHLRFIVPDFSFRFFFKYKKLFPHLTSYEILNPAANVSVHCFPGVVVGLHFHGPLTVYTTKIPEGYSRRDFNQFLRESYNLKKQDLSQMEKPVMVLISRQNSRMFLNEDEMVNMMKALGFTVIIAKPGMMADLDKLAEVLNSCSVLVGAHGAGLTNEVFLPEGAVMVQLVGLGQADISSFCFGDPAEGMGLNYLEYKVEPEESSLVSLYGEDHPIVVDPESLAVTKGYKFVKAVYLDQQKFNINVARFRETLIKALGLLGRPIPLG